MEESLWQPAAGFGVSEEFSLSPDLIAKIRKPFKLIISGLNYKLILYNAAFDYVLHDQPTSSAGFGIKSKSSDRLPDPGKGPSSPAESLIRDENWNGELQTKWIYLGEITIREDAVEKPGRSRKRLVYAEERRIPDRFRSYYGM